MLKIKKFSFAGFHLIEILIVLAIISILASFSLPSFKNYLVQERRLEAASMLTKLSIAMEQYHIEHNTYQGATLTALNFPELVAKNNYRLNIQTNDATDYKLTAKPQASQAANDQACGGLTLDANGEQGVTGSGKMADCW